MVDIRIPILILSFIVGCGIFGFISGIDNNLLLFKIHFLFGSFFLAHSLSGFFVLQIEKTLEVSE